MRSAIKGFLLWIFNNVFLIVVVDSVFLCLKELTLKAVLFFVIFGLLWLLTGVMIVSSFVFASEEEHKGPSIIEYEKEDQKTDAEIEKEERENWKPSRSRLFVLADWSKSNTDKEKE